MSRNAAGNYSLPLPSVVIDTAVDPAWANATLNDLATEMTDSFSRSGKGAMLSTLLAAQGALGGTGGYAFTGETNSGLYRSAAGDLRLAITGTDRGRWTATGFWADVLQALAAGTLTLKGRPAAGGSAVGVVLDSENALGAGDKLVSIRSAGVEKAFVDEEGFIFPAGATVSLPKVITLAADFTTTSTSAVDVTGMNFAVAANKKYLFEAEGPVNVNATGTEMHGTFSGPAAPTYVDIGYECDIWAAAISAYPRISGQGHGFGGSLSLLMGVTNGGHSGQGKLRGYLENGANAGTVQLRVYSSVSTTTVKLFKGYALSVRKLL